jgi:hypothetical protein
MKIEVRLLLLVFPLLCCAAPPCAAAESDPVGLIGMDPASALETLGPPTEILSYRGAEESEDNVVFFYSDFIYLFWFRNRVWQVRFDRRFKGEVLGLKLGMRREDAGSGPPWAQTEQGNSVYFDLLQAQYPIRVRLVFVEGTLRDIYIYRSDY